MRTSLSLLGLLLLTGCGGVKYHDYEPLTGGCQVEEVFEGTFVVTCKKPIFGENDFARQNKFAVRRAAEKTLAMGFTHFTCGPLILDGGQFNRLFVRCYNSEEAPEKAYEAEKVVRFQSEK